MHWENAEKQVLLSRIYDLRRQRLFSEMEEEVQTALERFPSDPQLLVLLADSLRARNRFSEAQEALNKVRDQSHTSPQFHGLQGALEFQRQEYEKALESFRCAHSLDSSPFYLKRQADCLLALKRFAPALSLLQQITDSRSDVYTLGALARAHEGLGAVDEARRCYEEILNLEPANSYAKSRVLRLRTSGKGAAEAEKEVDRMLRIPSRRGDTALLSVKAEQLKKSGDYRGAAEIYARILQNEENQSGSQHAFYRRALAFAYYKANMYEEAYPILQNLVSENSGDVYCRGALVTAARKLQRVKELSDFFFALARQSAANRALFGIARNLSKEIARNLSKEAQDDQG